MNNAMRTHPLRHKIQTTVIFLIGRVVSPMQTIHNVSFANHCPPLSLSLSLTYVHFSLTNKHTTTT